MKYACLFCFLLLFGVAFAAYDPDPNDLSSSFESYYDDYWNDEDFMNAYQVAKYLDLFTISIEDSIADDINYTGDNIIKEDITELVKYLNQFNIDYVDIVDTSYVHIIHKQAASLDNVLLFDQTPNNLFFTIDSDFKSDNSLSSNELLNSKDVNIAIIYKSTNFVYKSSFAVSYIDGKNSIEDTVSVTNNVHNMNEIKTTYRGVNFVFMFPVFADSRLFLGGSYLFVQNDGTRYIKEIGNYNIEVTGDSQQSSDDINYFYHTNYYSLYGKLNFVHELSKTLSVYNNVGFNIIGSLGSRSYQESDSDYALNVELSPYKSKEINYQLGFSNYIDALIPLHFNIATRFTYYIGSSRSVKQLSFVEAAADAPDKYWVMESTPVGNFEYSFFLSFFIGNFSIQYYISRRDKFINNSIMLYYGIKVGSNYYI